MKGDDKPECFKYAFKQRRYRFHPVSFSIIELIRIFYLTLCFCTKYERRKPGDDWFKFKQV